MAIDRLDFTGSDFCLHISELSEGLARDLLDCATPGQSADDAVAYVLSQYTVTCDPEQAKRYLRPYGAWEEAELEDHEANLGRLVWLTACGLAEAEGEAYFSAY